jgi:hypothetical protein
MRLNKVRKSYGYSHLGRAAVGLQATPPCDP